MYDAQIDIWQKQLIIVRRQMKISYMQETREEIQDEAQRLEQAIEARRQWLTEQK